MTKAKATKTKTPMMVEVREVRVYLVPVDMEGQMRDVLRAALGAKKGSRKLAAAEQDLDELISSLETHGFAEEVRTIGAKEIRTA